MLYEKQNNGKINRHSCWSAALTNPSAPKNEIEYARIAEKTQHIIFSRTIKKADPVGIGKMTTRVINANLKEEVLKLKQQPGKDMILLGGSDLVSGFVNHDLVDEYRISVNPVVLGGGKPLFKNIKNRINLNLVEAKTFHSGVVRLHYKTVK